MGHGRRRHHRRQRVLPADPDPGRAPPRCTGRRAARRRRLRPRPTRYLRLPVHYGPDPRRGPRGERAARGPDHRCGAARRCGRHREGRAGHPVTGRGRGPGTGVGHPGRDVRLPLPLPLGDRPADQPRRGHPAAARTAQVHHVHRHPRHHPDHVRGRHRQRDPARRRYGTAAAHRRSRPRHHPGAPRRPAAAHPAAPHQLARPRPAGAGRRGARGGHRLPQRRRATAGDEPQNPPAPARRGGHHLAS